MGCLVSIFTIRINSEFSPGRYAPYRKKGTYPNFGNVRCLILRIKTNSTLQCWCDKASDILKKSRLNWKLKISNTEHNTGITQLQVCETRYRRMQELNGLCVSKKVNSCVTCQVHQWKTLPSSIYCSAS